MPSISVVLRETPSCEEDPLGKFLEEIKTQLLELGINPDDPRQIVRTDKHTLTIHYNDRTPNATITALLDKHRQRYGYCTGVF